MSEEAFERFTEEYVRILAEKIEVLEKQNKILLDAHLRISNKDSYGMIDGMMRNISIEAIKESKKT